MFWRRTLPFLLLIADSSGFRLQIPNLAEIKSDGARTKWIRFRFPSVLLKGGTEAANESIKTAPSLAERTRAGGRRIRVSVKWAYWDVDLGFPELVQVPEEFQHVCTAASGEGKRGAVVFQILTKSIPVTAFLIFVPAG